MNPHRNQTVDVPDPRSCSSDVQKLERQRSGCYFSASMLTMQMTFMKLRAVEGPPGANPLAEHGIAPGGAAGAFHRKALQWLLSS
eukprot:3641342-Amphidinium_carterae.2